MPTVSGVSCVCVSDMGLVTGEKPQDLARNAVWRFGGRSGRVGAHITGRQSVFDDGGDRRKVGQADRGRGGWVNGPGVHSRGRSVVAGRRPPVTGHESLFARLSVSRWREPRVRRWGRGTLADSGRSAVDLRSGASDRSGFSSSVRWRRMDTTLCRLCGACGRQMTGQIKCPVTATGHTLSLNWAGPGPQHSEVSSGRWQGLQLARRGRDE